MVYNANECIVFRVVPKKFKQWELNLNFKYPLKILKSTLTKKQREKNENSELVHHVISSLHTVYHL